MKLQTIIKILVLVPLFSFAQQSENYLELMNNLVPIDSSKIETSFNNGKPKYIGTTTYYEYMDKEYAFLTGKHIRYYKNGSRTEGVYNSWGTVLTNKYFDKNGTLISDSKTITLDTSAKNLQEFEDSDKHITFVIKSNDYKYSSDLNKWYLYLESEHTNGKKSGTWNYYLPNGELKKEKKQ
ncbi:hypothetical protein E1J38_014820 [Seonamhaeicola sediminis]|uniref:Toxin-antitoxin system YwqK family antitoxin n=1 Tax=Seonamhaeicola sediminis TaxID=2528206 RepID=A0A562Y8K8_9FLAO|nr:hypothetical protein [Seonamhaeicola sediminis]TWO30407.1 hypothetical protein E1J38_014820 [Seonamhaeicola sediminis]